MASTTQQGPKYRGHMGGRGVVVEYPTTRRLADGGINMQLYVLQAAFHSVLEHPTTRKLASFPHSLLDQPTTRGLADYAMTMQHYGIARGFRH